MTKQIKPIQRYRGEVLRPGRPFWLPASNYYVLTIAIATGTFFLIWGVLQDGREATPWVAAGIFASGAIIVAVVLREVILRSARNRYLSNQRRLDRSLQGIIPQTSSHNEREKLTLEKNALILTEIRRKSEAAKVLGRFSEGHREVFDMCVEYLAAADRELPMVGAGSPRIAAFHKGREQAHQFQRFHLLQWAEIEARSYTQEANNRVKIAERLEAAQKALGIVDFALKVYPNEESLLESESALKEFLASIKVSQMIDKAERAEFKGNHSRALTHYNNALFELGRDEVNSDDRQVITEKIDAEVERIQNLMVSESRSDDKNKSK